MECGRGDLTGRTRDPDAIGWAAGGQRLWAARGASVSSTCECSESLTADGVRPGRGDDVEGRFWLPRQLGFSLGDSSGLIFGTMRSSSRNFLAVRQGPST